MVINDFDYCPVLWKHRVYTNIDGYGKLAYFKLEDACAFVNKVRSIFCRCTDKVECFFCYKLRVHSGEELIAYLESSHNNTNEK